MMAMMMMTTMSKDDGWMSNGILKKIRRYDYVMGKATDLNLISRLSVCTMMQKADSVP